MAIYHFSVKMISRGQGRSSVAAAAYRSSTKLFNETTGLLHDFQVKSHDVINSAILLPDNAPSWMKDREKLWNAVELRENKTRSNSHNAQTARELEISLPRELTPAQNWELITAFVQTHFVKEGMIADINMHRGHKNRDGQPHAHVMLTTRSVSEKGFGLKSRKWNSKSLLLRWRKAWADHCNQKFAELDMNVHIDHRSFKDMGIDLEPQRKIGNADLKKNAARLEESRRIARENGKKILAHPTIALEALTKMDALFSEKELQAFLFRHSDSNEQFQQLLAKVSQHPDLVSAVRHPSAAASNRQYTTKAMLIQELKMLKMARSLEKSTAHQLSPRSVRNVASYRRLSSEQQQALLHLTTGGDVSCLVGYAGTGKSYLLNAAREAWERQGYQVKGMTLSGIAAEGLAAESGIESRTIASWQHYWQHNKETFSKNTVVVVDEAGMVATKQLKSILEAATQAGAKVVLVGDNAQLQAIEAGAAFRAVLERIGFAEMNQIKRQKVVWQQQASKHLAKGSVKKALEAYQHHDCIFEHQLEDHALYAMIAGWEEIRSNHPKETQLMLAYRRSHVAQLNAMARQVRHENGELGATNMYKTTRGKRKFAVGERLYFLANNPALGVKNGTLGTLLQCDSKNMTVALDAKGQHKKRTITFSLEDYHALDYGYAATIHKAQGMTVDRTHIYASKSFDRYATYVALSRHRENVLLHWSHENMDTVTKDGIIPADFNWMCKLLGKDRKKEFASDHFTKTEIQLLKLHLHDKKPIHLPALTPLPSDHSNAGLDEAAIREVIRTNRFFPRLRIQGEVTPENPRQAMTTYQKMLTETEKNTPLRKKAEQQVAIDTFALVCVNDEALFSALRSEDTECANKLLRRAKRIAAQAITQEKEAMKKESTKINGMNFPTSVADQSNAKPTSMLNSDAFKQKMLKSIRKIHKMDDEINQSNSKEREIGIDIDW